MKVGRYCASGWLDIVLSPNIAMALVSTLGIPARLIRQPWRRQLPPPSFWWTCPSPCARPMGFQDPRHSTSARGARRRDRQLGFCPSQGKTTSRPSSLCRPSGKLLDLDACLRQLLNKQVRLQWVGQAKCLSVSVSTESSTLSAAVELIMSQRRAFFWSRRRRFVLVCRKTPLSHPIGRADRFSCWRRSDEEIS